MLRLVGASVAALVLSTVLVACAGAATSPSQTAGPVVLLQVEVIERYAHGLLAYTQGLELVDGRLYEGTGQYGQSTLREVEPDTGAVVRSIALDQRYFGESIAVV